MQATLARPLAARRRVVMPVLAVTAVFGLGWGAAFGAGVLYGRTSANAPTQTGATSTGGTGTGSAPVAPVAPAPVDAGHAGPAAPAGGH